MAVWDDSELNDASLAGVDPYDPKLTAETKQKIIKEAKTSPRYFFKRVVKDSDDKDMYDVQ